MSIPHVQTNTTTADTGVPAHVAIIMDGNGRWAELRSKPRRAGHRAGVAPVRAAVEHAARRGISYLTLFAFSTENWQRPRDEVSSLMRLFLEALQRELAELHRNNVRLRFIGRRELLQRQLLERIEAAETRTRDNTGLTLTIAVAYGGRWDMTNAARQLAARVERGEITAADVDEQAVSESLALAGMPDPDLLIRTGGEKRISNFLLWHLAYAELYFCDCLWPDFDQAQLDEAIEYYARRQRRYGHTAKQLEAP